MASWVQVKSRAQISFDHIYFDGHFISVGELKRLICEKKALGDAVNELVLNDPANIIKYNDDTVQIPKGSRVMYLRVPANRARVLVGATPLPRAPPPQATNSFAGADNGHSTNVGGDAAADDFGADPFAQSAANLLQEQAAARSLAQVAGVAPGPSKSERDRPSSWGLSGRGGPGAARGGGGRGRGPAMNYICRRCNEQGKHWEKDCHTVGDPSYDYRTVRMPTGIPITKLQRNADGSLYLPTGELGELAPNQAAFREELARMSGAAAALQAEATDVAVTPAIQSTALMLPEAAVKSEAVDGSSLKDEPSASVPASVETSLPSVTPAPEAAAVHESADAGPKPEQAEQPSAREPDLFDDDELEQSAAPIPISIGAASEPPHASPVRTNGNVEMTDLGLAKAWACYHALKDDLPAGTTIKLFVEAFGAGRPMTAAEFKQFQQEHRSALPRSWRHSQRSQEQDQQQGTRSLSRGRESLSRTSDERRRSCSRSRSRSRGRDPKRMQGSLSPVSLRSRETRRTPSLLRDDEQPASKKPRAEMEKRPANAPGGGARGRERSPLAEESTRVAVKQAHDNVEMAGRKRHRDRDSSAEVSERRFQDQDRCRRGEPEDQKQSRSRSPEAFAERHSTDSGRDVADEGTSREGEHNGHGDNKKSKKKHRKEHKKRKDKHHKKDRKSKRKSRSLSPPVGRARSVGGEDRYIPSDYEAPSRDEIDRDGEAANNRRRPKVVREERKHEDHDWDHAPARSLKKAERPAAPGPGVLFQRALTSVERSNSLRR